MKINADSVYVGKFQGQFFKRFEKLIALLVYLFLRAVSCPSWRV
jgi:hypothetical protein